MALIAMLVAGITTGLACRSWRQAKRIVLIVFAVTLVMQTPIVASESGFENGVDVVIYTLIQSVALVLGLGISRLLVRRREQRAAIR